MATQKQEKQLNTLFNEIKKCNLTQEEIDQINVEGFLYSVGRLNILQITAILTKIALNHNIDITKIKEYLS